MAARGRMVGEDEIGSVLEEVALGAEAAAADQRRLAEVARALQRRWQAGGPKAGVLTGSHGRRILTLLDRTIVRVRDVNRRYRLAVADHLTREGLSTREVASHLGVSHQRVSAMLRDQPPARPRA